MPRGTLSLTGTTAAIPIFSPPYTNTTHKFSDISIAAISYRVSHASVQHLVPDVLELEAEPLVTTLFVKYGMSTVGSYNEFVHHVEVTYEGEKYNYSLVLVLDNEAAIFAGREAFGFPKVFGRTDIRESTGGRAIVGHVERPVGERIVDFEFLPEELLKGTKPQQAPKRRTLNLRVVPSADPAKPPAVKEFVPVYMDMEFKDVWVGKGNVSFLKKSAINPWANMDILRYEGAFYAQGVSAVLQNPTEAFPL